jgi:hypothetical protein
MSPKPKRLTVSQHRELFDYKDKTLIEMQELIVNLIKQYGEDAYIGDYHYPYEDTPYPYVFTDRPENDQEYNTRIEKSGRENTLRAEWDLREARMIVQQQMHGGGSR